MNFTHEEKVAICHLCKLMATADNKVEDVELQVIALEMRRIIGSDSIDAILDESNDMEPADACAICSRITSSEKRYVCSVLAAILASDGDIDDAEIALWTLISKICGFPSMTLRDALTYMTEL